MSESVFGILNTTKYKLVVLNNNGVGILCPLPENKKDRETIISLSKSAGGTVLYSGTSKLKALEAFINTIHMNSINNSSNTVDKCAMDIFAHNVTKIIYSGDEFMGLSMGKPFVFSPDGGFWGSKNVVYQDGRPQIMLTTPKGKVSRTALETVLAVLDNMLSTRSAYPSYDGYVGNCLGNEAAQLRAISVDRAEIVTRGQNTVHGIVWNQCFKQAKCRVYFSAKNMTFIGYILSKPQITEADILNYPGGVVKDVWDGDTYYCIP